jgi:S1-C subfamily serine protease
MSSRFAALVVGVTALIAGLAGGWFLAGQPALTAPPEAQVQPAPSPTPAAITALPDLSAVAEAALKVSANIATTTLVRAPDDFFSQFFGGGPRLQQSQSLGSGVLVSADGYVLTNTHVIGDERATVRVPLSDGQERPGKVIGVDDVSDLAVVQVAAPPDVPLLPWGDSLRLRVAEWVMAVGNPFQLSGTVTLGIVSTVNRPGAQVGSEYSDFIQTDAAINPGNSGGALVNSRGELVGINTMIYSSSGGYQGIGFAIPTNTARDIMSELIEHGAVRWGSIGGGVRWYQLDRRTARANGYGEVEGLLVYQMLRDSSLYREGIRPGDVVVRFNGEPVLTVEDLNRMVIRAPVGSRAPLEIIREARRLTINVPIVERQPRGPQG